MPTCFLFFGWHSLNRYPLYIKLCYTNSTVFITDWFPVSTSFFICGPCWSFQSSVLRVFFVFFFIFVLCRMPNVACVSRSSNIEYPFGFLKQLLTSIAQVSPVEPHRIATWQCFSPLCCVHPLRKDEQICFKVVQTSVPRVCINDTPRSREWLLVPTHNSNNV